MSNRTLYNNYIPQEVARHPGRRSKISPNSAETPGDKIPTGPSPTESVSLDRGSNTLYHFGYQEMYTTILAIQMYRGIDVAYNEIFCEHQEDILAVRPDGLFFGIQVTSRDMKYGSFKLTEKKIEDTIRKFVVDSTRFPGWFAEFIIVADVGFSDVPDDSIDLLAAKLNENVTNLPCENWNIFIEKVQSASSASRSQVVDVIKRVRTMKGPHPDAIYARILDDHLANLPRCSQLTVDQNKIIRDKIVLHIKLASEKRSPNPLVDYYAFAKGKPVSRTMIEINAKRITRQILEDIIGSMGEAEVILGSTAPLRKIEDITMKKMVTKMASGGIDVSQIEMMRELALTADAYFSERFHLTESGQSPIPKKMGYLRQLVKNEAVEEYSRIRRVGQLYGRDLLHNLEDRLRRVANEQREIIQNTPYLALKGLTAILANECEIHFSDYRETGTE